jgi:hypothetical protein
MNRPNIFNYATSELSQDAIICYILEWVKIENKSKNEKLHKLAVNFLDSIFDKFKNITKPNNYKKIDITKQYKNIDVLCVINDKYVIIIEDKINTKNHSNQLERYFNIVKKDFNKAEIMPVYFKTGDQSNYDNVIKNGYKVYSRKDFLNVLDKKNYTNEIIKNYSDYLQNIENEVNSYAILPIDNWHYSSWKGFFIELRKKLGEGNWNYVSNQKGGFLGFWFDFDKNNKCEYAIYLQIDHNLKQITLKLRSNTDTKIEKSIINKWKKHIEYNKDNIIIKKPKVVRAGKKSTTIGVVESEFRITNDNGIININKTVDFIKKIQKIKLDKLKSV